MNDQPRFQCQCENISCSPRSQLQWFNQVNCTHHPACLSSIRAARDRFRPLEVDKDLYNISSRDVETCKKVRI